jgi:cellobiose phosphorylase
VSEVGALLLAPAYDVPDEKIGYITRYAPGLRENGGVYTHAATWAIAAAAKMRDAETVEQLLIAIDPSNKDSERYWAEPYVLPGNVDGPDSPLFGRAGWTWYTGSAAWLHRIVSEWVLGVRPEWDGLRIDPVIPPSWDRARMTRPWRGSTYEIEIERTGTYSLEMDGKTVEGGVIAVPTEDGTHKVKVTV